MSRRVFVSDSTSTKSFITIHGLTGCAIVLILGSISKVGRTLVRCSFLQSESRTGTPCSYVHLEPLADGTCLLPKYGGHLSLCVTGFSYCTESKTCSRFHLQRDYTLTWCQLECLHDRTSYTRWFISCLEGQQVRS